MTWTLDGSKPTLDASVMQATLDGSGSARYSPQIQAGVVCVKTLSGNTTVAQIIARGIVVRRTVECLMTL